MGEESPLRSEGGCESCVCQEGMLWMLGSAMGLGFGIGDSPWVFLFTFLRPFQAWLGVWVYRCWGVGKVGRARLRWEGNS